MSSLLSSKLFNNKNFYNAFEKDLKRAQQSVLIESPFITTKRMDNMLPLLQKLQKRGVRIVVNTRSPVEHDGEHVLQAILAVTTMQKIGVTVLYTGKHHRKLAIIDNEILWEGSLNILSQNDSCEVMRRSVSKRLANEMMYFIGVKQWLQ